TSPAAPARSARARTNCGRWSCRRAESPAATWRCADVTAGRPDPSAARARFERKKQDLGARIAAAGGAFSLRKRTASNLFRYTRRKGIPGAARVDLGVFNEILHLDADAMTLDVEGLATFE